MLYRRHLLVFVAVVLSVSADFSPISYGDNGISVIKVRNVRKVDPLQSGRDFAKHLDFKKLLKTLRQNRSTEEVRIVGILGLVSSALTVEESMRENLYQLTDELLDSFEKSTPNENMKKLIVIEETINRDKSMIQVLNAMLKNARNVTTLDELQTEMQNIKQENDATSKRLRSKKLAIQKEIGADVNRRSATTGKLMDESKWNMKNAIKERLYDVRDMIDNHVDDIHSSVTENVKQTIKYVQNVQKHNSKLAKPTTRRRKVKLDSSLSAVRRLWDQVASPDSSESNVDVKLNYRSDAPEVQQNTRSIEVVRLTRGEKFDISTISPVKVNLTNPKLKRFKRENGSKFKVDIDLGFDDKTRPVDENNRIEEDEDPKSDSQGDFEESSSEPEEPGGLVGLITNLSGGEEGSDVGAIIGALSQVISNLFGPGGLDVPGLVESGTALLASLLAGDDYFGTYAGNLIGLAINGFSGGGAERNGQFFGQVVGRFISVLSADEENEDAPIQPNVFIENLYKGILEGSAKQAEVQEGVPEGDQKPNCQDEDGGFDSSAFIKSLLSGLFNVFAKASAGSSAGSSQGSAKGSAQLSGTSSQGSAKASTGASGASSKGISGVSSGALSGTEDDTEMIRQQVDDI